MGRSTWLFAFPTGINIHNLESFGIIECVWSDFLARKKSGSDRNRFALPRHPQRARIRKWGKAVLVAVEIFMHTVGIGKHCDGQNLRENSEFETQINNNKFKQAGKSE